jgi:hypothetical protein
MQRRTLKPFSIQFYTEFFYEPMIPSRHTTYCHKKHFLSVIILVTKVNLQLDTLKLGGKVRRKVVLTLNSSSTAP